MAIDKDTFQEYIKAQIDQILLDKWLAGEKVGRDPGDDYVRQWAKENAPSFRKKYIKEEGIQKAFDSLCEVLIENDLKPAQKDKLQVIKKRLKKALDLYE